LYIAERFVTERDSKLCWRCRI